MEAKLVKKISFEELKKSVRKNFYSVKELSEILGVSRSLIYAKVEAGVLPCKRLGKRILIPYDFVERAFLQ